MIDRDIAKANGGAADAAGLRRFQRNGHGFGIFRSGSAIAEPLEADLQMLHRII